MNLKHLIRPIALHRFSKVQELKESVISSHQTIYIPNQIQRKEMAYFKQDVLEPVHVQSESSLREEEEIVRRSVSPRISTQFEGSVDQTVNSANDRHQLKPSAAPKLSKISVSHQTKSKQKPKSSQQKGQVILINPKTLFDVSQELQQPFQHINNQKQSQKSIEPPQLQCKCSTSLNQFIKNSKQKFKTLQHKINTLESQNKSLKQTHEQILNKNRAILLNIQKMQKEKKELNVVKEKHVDRMHFKVKQPLGDKTSKVVNIDKNVRYIDDDVMVKQQNIGHYSKIQTLLHRLQLRIQKS